MKTFIINLVCSVLAPLALAQEGIPTDYLSAEFHKERREALREKLPSNSVAVFFANPVRNRANDVDYIYHQDPDFYYLTGYKEPHAVLVVFSDDQTDESGNTYNELLYVQERNPRAEQWTGYRLGVEGAKSKLGWEKVFNGKEFLKSGIDYAAFDKVFFKEFKDDYRDNERDPADLASLIGSFKQQVGYGRDNATEGRSGLTKELEQEQQFPQQQVNIDTREIRRFMAGLRQIKTKEELELLTKAVRISAMGQREIMKAMHPGMSETEIQGVHEYIYKKYGSEYEGYPSIVGAGNNGCVLHYIENNKTKVGNDLVLMDLGAEYHGYTADVTRTIPANGKFTPEQKQIYELVYRAQEAGIAAAVVGNPFRAPEQAARKVINEGLVELGIVRTEEEARQYFPHGTSHYLGLDVHDPGLGGAYEPNMVITVEPGIYIPEGSDCDPKWHGIAVRIEDDILITEKGPQNLSAEAPRKVDEIEALMQQESVLNGMELPKL